MSEKYIGIDLGSEFLKIAVHENNRICGEISERIPEQIRMDGKILSLESAAEFLKETGRKHGLSRYGACVVLPEKQVITKRVRMAGMDPKHLILNLPYEFMIIWNTVWKNGSMITAWRIRYRMERDRMKAWIFWRLQCLSGLWSGTRN